MNWLQNIGSKLSGVAKVGSKLLRGASNIGAKAAGMANKFLDGAESVPYLGAAMQKIPGYQTGRELVRTVDLASQLGRRGADVLDTASKGQYTKASQDARRVGSDIEKTYKQQRQKIKDLNYT